MQTYLLTCIHTHTYIRITYMYAHIKYINTHVINMYVCTCMYVCMYVRMCIYMYIYIYPERLPRSEVLRQRRGSERLLLTPIAQRVECQKALAISRSGASTESQRQQSLDTQIVHAAGHRSLQAETVRVPSNGSCVQLVARILVPRITWMRGRTQPCSRADGFMTRTVPQ